MPEEELTVPALLAKMEQAQAEWVEREQQMADSIEQARVRWVARKQQAADRTAAALSRAPKACHHQSAGRGACLECYAAWIRGQRAAMHPDKAVELADTDRIDARIEAELEAGLDWVAFMDGE